MSICQKTRRRPLNQHQKNQNEDFLVTDQELYDNYTDGWSLVLSLEDKINSFAGIIDDLQLVRNNCHDQEVVNMVDSLTTIYQMKYDALWKEFELLTRKFGELGEQNVVEVIPTKKGRKSKK